MSAPMRNIGTTNTEIIRIGRNKINAMTASMQIHTIHRK
jgi:hypothetical protein